MISVAAVCSVDGADCCCLVLKSQNQKKTMKYVKINKKQQMAPWAPKFRPDSCVNELQQSVTASRLSSFKGKDKEEPQWIWLLNILWTCKQFVWSHKFTKNCISSSTRAEQTHTRRVPPVDDWFVYLFRGNKSCLQESLRTILKTLKLNLSKMKSVNVSETKRGGASVCCTSITAGLSCLLLFLHLVSRQETFKNKMSLFSCWVHVKFWWFLK